MATPNFSSGVRAIISTISMNPKHVYEADECLSSFARLSDAEKKAALPLTIERIFPLVFGEQAVLQGSLAYTNDQQQPWSPNCWLSPKVIVSPSTAQQVSQIFSLCRFLGATFSVRGGGHLQNPGFCSNDGGVVISMANFNQISVSEDKKTAKVGLGLKWLQVYEYLEGYGLAVTGGRMPTVGVPGLLLGGGLSYHVGEYGFSCSGVIDYEVVLADSSIVHANPRENTDLFWALKGGGPNFGIVTAIEMATVPNMIWAESRFYDPSQNTNLIEAMMAYSKAIGKDKNAILYFLAVEQATLINFVYSRPVEKDPEIFKFFDNIPYMSHLMEPGCKSIFEVVKGTAAVLDFSTKYHDMRMVSSEPDLEAFHKADECHRRKMEELHDVEGLVLTMSFQPLPAAAMEATNARGGSPMSIPTKTHQWFMMMADWSKAEDEERVLAACREIVDVMETTTKKNGTHLPFIYSNYASRDQNPLASYGAENLRKLREIAAQYDPDGVFQTLQGGGWLLSRA